MGNAQTARHTLGERGASWNPESWRPRGRPWSSWILYGDVPGVMPEDLDVRFEKPVLTIHGKVRPRHQDVKFLHCEYGVGNFHRALTIGDAIHADRISAELKNGVVTVHLPKSEKVKPRHIEV